MLCSAFHSVITFVFMTWCSEGEMCQSCCNHLITQLTQMWFAYKLLQMINIELRSETLCVSWAKHHDWSLWWGTVQENFHTRNGVGKGECSSFSNSSLWLLLLLPVLHAIVKLEIQRKNRRHLDKGGNKRKEEWRTRSRGCKKVRKKEDTFTRGRSRKSSIKDE